MASQWMTGYRLLPLGYQQAILTEEKTHTTPAHSLRRRERNSTDNNHERNFCKSPVAAFLRAPNDRQTQTIRRSSSRAFGVQAASVANGFCKDFRKETNTMPKYESLRICRSGRRRHAFTTGCSICSKNGTCRCRRVSETNSTVRRCRCRTTSRKVLSG